MLVHPHLALEVGHFLIENSALNNKNVSIILTRINKKVNFIDT